MAAIQVDPKNVDFSELYQNVSKRLPLYAIPLFLRFCKHIEETEALNVGSANADKSNAFCERIVAYDADLPPSELLWWRERFFDCPSQVFQPQFSYCHQRDCLFSCHLTFTLKGTYKLKKVTYQKEGFNPEEIHDPMLFLDAKQKTYIPLNKELYSGIVKGNLRL